MGSSQLITPIAITTKLAAPGSPADAAGGLLAPSSPTVTPQGTTGATTCTYKLVSVDAAGHRSLSTANITTATANATQTGVNKNHLAWTAATDPSLHHVEVYRTAGGADQGFIGTVLAGTATFDDTGIASAGSPVLPVATTRKYKIVALGVPFSSGAARRSVASAEASQAASPETLSADTPMHVTWATVTGATGYEVYRTDVLLTKGLVGIVAAGVLAFDDTGIIPGTAVDPPSTDSTGTGEPIDVAALEQIAFQIGGTFVATIQPEGTINGVDWVSEGSALTAVELAAVTKNYSLMRFTMTAFTSGAPTCALIGKRY